MIPHRLGGAQWALLGILALLWGSAFLFIEVSLRGLPVFAIAWGRVAIAAVVLWLYAKAVVPGFSLRGMPAMPFAVMGLLGSALPYSLLVLGQTRLPSGTAGILISTTPLIAAVASRWLAPDEPLTRRRLAGIATGLMGVGVIMGPSAVKGLGGEFAAQAAVVGAAASYALSAIWGKRFRGLPAESCAAAQFCAAAVLLLPAFLIVSPPWRPEAPGWGPAAALLVLGLACTAVAAILFFRLLAAAGAGNTLLVTFLIPVVAMALGIGVLGEAFSLRQGAGLLLVCSGLLVVDGRMRLPASALALSLRPFRTAPPMTKARSTGPQTEAPKASEE